MARHCAETSVDAAPPGGPEIGAARNRGQQINPDGRDPELQDAVGVHHVFDAVIEIGAPEEVMQRRQDLAGIFGGRLYQNVKILCGPRPGVKRDGVRPDHQIPRPMGV